MENLSTRNDIEVYINLLSDVNKEIRYLKEKWMMFYFGWISPFKICNVSKEDFIFFANRFPKSQITTSGSSDFREFISFMLCIDKKVVDRLYED